MRGLALLATSALQAQLAHILHLYVPLEIIALKRQLLRRSVLMVLMKIDMVLMNVKTAHLVEIAQDLEMMRRHSAPSTITALELVLLLFALMELIMKILKD